MRSRGQDWAVPLFVRSRDPAEMSRHRYPLRDRATFGELLPDLYVVPCTWPRIGRTVKHDVETWRVVDDWPARVPVSDAEIDLFEAWFIEAGVADLDDPALKERVASLKAIRDQAQADAERAAAMLESSAQQAVRPRMVQRFARTARERIRIDGG